MLRAQHLGSVPVTVRVVVRNGEVLFDRVIDARDLWSEVEDDYPELICERGAARLGPKYWNGSSFGWFEIPVPTAPK